MPARSSGHVRTAQNWSWGAPGGFPQVVSEQERHPPNANHPTSQEAARGHRRAAGPGRPQPGHRRQRRPALRRTGTARPAQRELRPAHLPAHRAAVYQGTPANPLVRPWGVYQGLAEMAWHALPRRERRARRPCSTRSSSARRRPGSATGSATTTSATASRSTSSSPPAATPRSSCRPRSSGWTRGSARRASDCPRRPSRRRTRRGSTASPQAWATPTWRSSCSPTAPSPCARRAAPRSRPT